MIDYKYSDLFLKDGADKQLHIVSDDKTIHITNSELHFEQFELTESLCSQSQLKFGSCEASVVKFKISNVFLQMVGKWLDVSMVLDKKEDDPFTFGRYKVISDVPTTDKRYRNVTAYDALYDIINSDVSSWYNGLTFPMTLKSFRNSFFSWFGVEQEPIELINDDMTVEETIKPSELSGADVIQAICEINGCFGHVNRKGRFEYKFLKKFIFGLYPRNDLFPADGLFPREANVEKIGKNRYKKIEYEDFVCKKIDRLQIRQEENDIGAVYPDSNVSEEENNYVVEDNFLVYGKGSEELESIARKLFGIIGAVTYRPFSADAVANPCIEVGEPIQLHTNLEAIVSYVLSRTIKGIQLLNDAISAEGNEKYDKRVNSVQKSIVQLRGKTNTLTRNVEETRIEIKDMEKGLTSLISQTTTEIRTEVSNTAKGLQSQITQNAGNINQKVSKDSIVSEINQTPEKITIKANRIDLNGLVTANEFVSKYATIETLNVTRINLENLVTNSFSAVSGRVGNLEADHVSVSSFDSVNSRLQNVEANYISAETVKAQYMEVANWTSAGKIRADRIDANTINAKLAEINRVHVQDLLSDDGVHCRRVTLGALSITASAKWRTFTVGGTSYTALCQS